MLPIVFFFGDKNSLQSNYLILICLKHNYNIKHMSTVLMIEIMNKTAVNGICYEYFLYAFKALKNRNKIVFFFCIKNILCSN